LLIQVKAGSGVKMAPWLVNKLRMQASAFELSELIRLHKRLLAIDIEIKTGNNLVKLPQLLDAVLMSV